MYCNLNIKKEEEGVGQIPVTHALLDELFVHSSKNKVTQVRLSLMIQAKAVWINGPNLSNLLVSVRGMNQ